MLASVLDQKVSTPGNKAGTSLISCRPHFSHILSPMRISYEEKNGDNQPKTGASSRLTNHKRRMLLLLLHYWKNVEGLNDHVTVISQMIRQPSTSNVHCVIVSPALGWVADMLVCWRQRAIRERYCSTRNGNLMYLARHCR